MQFTNGWNPQPVNAAERAIQTFKDAFIVAQATTDCDFPLHLWDKLAPQVQNTVNQRWEKVMLAPSSTLKLDTFLLTQAPMT